MVTAEMLRRIPLFAGLPAEQRAHLAGAAHERRYPKGALVFSAGEPGEAVYVVLDGRVKVYRLSPDGHEQLMGLFGPHEPFGLVAALDRSPYPATAETTEESRLLALRTSELQGLMAANPPAFAALLREVGQRLRRAQGRVHSLSALSVHQRIAEFLLEQARSRSDGPGRPGGDPDDVAGAVRIRLTLTHQELGSYIGASRETVTRALADLRRKEALRVLEGDALLLFPDRLQAILKGER